jgi:dTDP-4-amino-4,6-dideoxygalactose transaminase
MGKADAFLFAVAQGGAAFEETSAMSSVATKAAPAEMYVPAWPTPHFRHAFGPKPDDTLPLPLRAEHRTTFCMARYGIYHLFKSLNLQRGGTVLLPDYHSGIEVWALKAAGLSIQYFNIDSHFQPDLDQLKRLCTRTTRAIYVIHYAGWPQPVDELVTLCRERRLVLFEDCALSMLSRHNGQELGSFGDYSVFCLYKTVPVPNGAVLIQNRLDFPDLTRLQMKPPTAVSVAARSAELMLEGIRSRSNRLGEVLTIGKRAAGDALSALRVKRLPIGDITPQFNSDGFRLDNPNVGMTTLCERLLTRFNYNTIVEKRRSNFATLQRKLAAASLVRSDLPPGTCPLFLPLLVPRKAEASKVLAEEGIQTLEFWNYGHPDAEPHTSPTARFLRNHVLEIPLHQEISESQLTYMADRILQHRLHL